MESAPQTIARKILGIFSSPVDTFSYQLSHFEHTRRRLIRICPHSARVMSSQYASGSYLSPSNNDYGQKAEDLYSDNCLDVFVDRRQFGERSHVYLGRELQSETTALYADSQQEKQALFFQQEKQALFRTFFKWFKPRGKFLISDYCKSSETPSPEISEYIKQRGYDLHDVQV
ncbi:hypothetical protein Bca101_068349 [Brassica carinata]